MNKILQIGLCFFFFCTSAHAALQVGEEAPNFSLTDINGEQHSLLSQRGKYVVLEWVNYDCPFVKKHYKNGDMQNLQKEFGDQGVVWYAIGSSARGKQGHYSTKNWQKRSQKLKVQATAILVDEAGAVGRAYGAKTTPHMFVIDPQGTLIYQGAIDSIRSASARDVAKADNYVRQALTQAMNGQSVSDSDTPPYGCSVKYGNPTS